MTACETSPNSSNDFFPLKVQAYMYLSELVLLASQMAIEAARMVHSTTVYKQLIPWVKTYSTRQTQGITQTHSTCETNTFS